MRHYAKRTVPLMALLLVCAATAIPSPEVDKLLAAPRQHPYLFFTADEIPKLREQATQEPWSDAAKLIISSADAVLSATITPYPGPGPDAALDENGNYTADYLKVHYDFYDAGHAINDIVPVLAMAYVLTGEQKYAQRAREWLLYYAGWQQWNVKTAPADNQSAHSYLGLAIGYDWLYEQLTPAEREMVLDALRRLGEAFEKYRGGLADLPLPGNRGSIANNHTWVSHAAPGLGALAQLYEQPAAREWLETEIVCWREKILPASLGRDGEYVDGAGGWLSYCLQNGLLFLAALRGNGLDLYEGTNLDKVAHFVLRGRELLTEGAPLPPYELRYPFLELASRYQDSVVQWAALANGMTLDQRSSRRWPGSQGVAEAPSYQANQWYRVRLEWDADSGHFRTTIDDELLEDMPMLDRTFGCVNRFAFMGHWRTRCSVDIRRLTVADLTTGQRIESVDLAGLPPGKIEDNGIVAFLQGAQSTAEIAAGEEPILRFTDADEGHAPLLSFALPDLSHGAIEFELRKSDNDASYFYLRTWEDSEELRGIIWYIDGRVRKHMPDYKNQDWPFGWKPTTGLWYPAVFEFLFYDARVQPVPPRAPAPSAVFRDLGQVQMRDNWSEDAISISFRSGPEIGKDHGDNNSFRIRAFGEEILPDLLTPPSGEKELTQRQYDLYAWFQGTQAHNTILPDEHTQPSVWGDQTGRQYGAQWLAAPEEGIAQRGELTDVLLTPFYDYASGQAAPAYTRVEPVLANFRRDLLFIKSDYVVVYDELQSTGAELLYKWLLHSTFPVSVRDGMMVVTGQKGSLYATPLFPKDTECEILTTPAPLDEHKTRYFSLRPPAKSRSQRFLVVLQPARADRVSPPLRPGLLEGTNLIGVDLSVGEYTDHVAFAPSDAGQGELGELSMEGLAAFVRTSASLPVMYALQSGRNLSLGRPLIQLSSTGSAAVSIKGDGFVARGRGLQSGEARLWLPRSPAELQLDGEAQDVRDYSPKGLLRLSVPEGEWTVTGQF